MVEKSFTFWEKEPYQLSTACTVTSGGRVLDGVYLRLGPGLTSHDLVPVKKNQIAPQAVMLMGDSVETFEAAKIHEMEANEKTKSGPWTWVGVQTRFFAALAIPGTPFGNVQFNSAPWKLREPEEKSDLPEKADIVSVWFPITGGQEVNLYLGPKSYEVLTAIREDLAKTIRFSDPNRGLVQTKKGRWEIFYTKDGKGYRRSFRTREDAEDAALARLEARAARLGRGGDLALLHVLRDLRPLARDLLPVDPLRAQPHRAPGHGRSPPPRSPTARWCASSPARR